MNNIQEMLPVGSVLHGTYRIESHISSGGFGNTYKASHLMLGKTYAIKEFYMSGVTERQEGGSRVIVSNSNNLGAFENQRDKFLKEARRLSAFENQHIVRVTDLFTENDTAYYVMEYIDGESLSGRLQRTKQPLSEAEALECVSQILDALGEVHASNLWHLDIKPANIMVTTDGIVKLIDFGASKQMGNDGVATTMSALAFTPSYAAPELTDQDFSNIGAWTDIYSVGATLYFLLTMSKAPQMSAIISKGKDAFAFPPAISENTRKLILWMMQINRNKRPQNVAELMNCFSLPSSSSIQSGILGFDLAVANEKTQIPQHQTIATASLLQQTAQYGSETTITQKVEKSSSAQHQASVAAQNDFSSVPELPPTPNKEVSHDYDLETDNSKKKMVIAIVAVIFIIAVGVAVFTIYKGKSSGATGADSTLVTRQVNDTLMTLASGKKCRYTGTLNANNQPQGQGKAVFNSDKSVYEGGFVNGYMETDKGKITYKDGNVYQGSFKNDHFVKGRFTYSDGEHYIGTFKLKNGSDDYDDGVAYDKHDKVICTYKNGEER